MSFASVSALGHEWNTVPDQNFSLIQLPVDFKARKFTGRAVQNKETPADPSHGGTFQMADVSGSAEYQFAPTPTNKCVLIQCKYLK